MPPTLLGRAERLTAFGMCRCAAGENRRLNTTTNGSVPAYLYQKMPQPALWSSRTISSAKSLPDSGESGLSSRPASEFPQGSVLGVRRPALDEFIRRHAPVPVPTSDPLDKPLGQRERTTLLTIIAALAKEANVDVSQPVKSGQIISDLIAAIGYEVAPNTVAGHLRTLHKTLFGETRKTPEGQ